MLSNLHSHSFSFLSQTIRNTGRHNSFREDVVAVDIFLYWENCHILAITRHDD